MDDNTNDELRGKMRRVRDDVPTTSRLTEAPTATTENNDPDCEAVTPFARQRRRLRGYGADREAAASSQSSKTKNKQRA